VNGLQYGKTEGIWEPHHRRRRPTLARRPNPRLSRTSRARFFHPSSAD
jgi:hypothetical protein